MGNGDMSVRSNSLVISSAFISVLVINLVYLVYVHITQSDLELQYRALDAYYSYLPKSVSQKIIDGGVIGTITVIVVEVLKSGAIAVTLFSVAKLISFLTFSLRRPTVNTVRPSDVPESSLLSIDRSRMPIMFIKPGYNYYLEGQRIEVKPEKVYGLLEETDMRIDRAEVKLSRPPQNAIEKLEIAAHQILLKHKNWTCDPGGHHSDKGLYEHSLHVASVMQKSSSHRLAKVIGLFHDIGKLLAYRNEGTEDAPKWKKVYSIHDRLSAEIVRHLPEFWELEPHDRDVINHVLTYCHSKSEIPTNVSSDAVDLIKKLRIADGYGIQADKQRGIEVAKTEDAQTHIKLAIERLLGNLNINDFKNLGRADGWTLSSVDYVAVLESNIRSKMSEYLSHDMAYKLQADVPIEHNRNHPLTEGIVLAIRDMGLLLEEVASLKAKNGFFNIKVGRRTFKDVILLDREKLEVEHSDLVSLWGDSTYNCRIVQIKDDGDDDGGAGDEET